MTTTYRNLLSLLSLMLFSAVLLEAQPVAKIRGYNQLYLLNLASGAESLLYTSPYPEIRSVKVSPDGSLFALLEVEYSNGQVNHLQVNHLKVFNPSGTLMYEGQRDVRTYTWDPNSNRLAYITGTFREGERSFDPTGFYLQDFLIGKEIRIPTDGFRPFALTWVSNSTEDAIYVESISQDGTKHFLRYNLLRETFETIPFRSIEVSPDGKYYSDHDVGCGCVKIFDRSTRTEQTRIKLSSTDVPIGWVYNESHLYVVTETSYNKIQRQIIIGGELRTATLNGSVKDGIITVVDGSNGQEVQAISGILPSRSPYAFMYTKPDLLMSISPSAAANGRQAPSRIEQIAITTIPEKYRQ